MMLSLAQNMHWMHFSNHHHLSQKTEAGQEILIQQLILEGLQQLLVVKTEHSIIEIISLELFWLALVTIL